jgi:hypothetical protein
MKQFLMVASLKSAIGSLGFTNGLLYLLGRAMQAFSEGRWRLIRYYLVAQPVPNPFVPVCRPSERDRVLAITLPDPMLDHCPRPRKVIQGRFEKSMFALPLPATKSFQGSYGMRVEATMRTKFTAVMSLPRLILQFGISMCMLNHDFG